MSGAMTASACIKMERFVDFVDTFHLPMVYFCDVPGFMVGLQSEKDGIIRFANKAMFAVREANVPYITIVTRRLYGVASGAAKTTATQRPPKKRGKTSKGVTDTDAVLNVIRKREAGATTAQIRASTGFSDKKIWSIVNRAKKQGRIKSKQRGVYVETR